MINPLFLKGIALIYLARSLAIAQSNETPHSMESSYWTKSMVRQYVHHSELQRRWAWSILSTHHFLGDEKVLDIGCGDGKIAADISKLVPKGKVVGIDPSKAMLHWSTRQYHPFEFPNLEFQLGSALCYNTEEKFDVIVSFCALQFCKDQVTALREIKNHLSPQGMVLLTFPAEGNDQWKQARLTIQRSPKWERYWKNYPFRKWYTAAEYKPFIQEAGLYLIQLDKISSLDPFIDKFEFIEWLKGVFPPVVPKDLEDEFYSEIIDEYIRIYPEAIDSNGVIYARLGRLEIKATLNP